MINLEPIGKLWLFALNLAHSAEASRSNRNHFFLQKPISEIQAQDILNILAFKFLGRQTVDLWRYEELERCE